MLGMISNPASFGGEAGQMVFGVFLWAIIILIGVNNIILSHAGRRKSLKG